MTKLLLILTLLLSVALSGSPPVQQETILNNNNNNNKIVEKKTDSAANKVEILKNFMQGKSTTMSTGGSEKIKSVVVREVAKGNSETARRQVLNQASLDSEEARLEKQEIEELIRFNNKVPVISVDNDEEYFKRSIEDQEKQFKLSKELNSFEADLSEESINKQIEETQASIRAKENLEEFRTDMIEDQKMKVLEQQQAQLLKEGGGSLSLLTQMRQVYKETQNQIVTNYELNNQQKAYFLVLITIVLPILLVFSISVCVGYILKQNFQRIMLREGEKQAEENYKLGLFNQIFGNLKKSKSPV